MKKRFQSIANKYAVFVAMLAVIVVVSGVAYAAFSDKAKQTGASFSVGSADIKLLYNPFLGVNGENLADELAGPSFTNISSSWQQDYAMKIYNNAATDLLLTSNANYLTANDPDDLRSIISVEIFQWEDQNGNTTIETEEIVGTFGKKTITKWKTEGFDLGALLSGSTKGLLLRFSTDNVSETKQGKTGTFDFEFNAVEN